MSEAAAEPPPARIVYFSDPQFPMVDGLLGLPRLLPQEVQFALDRFLILPDLDSEVG